MLASETRGQTPSTQPQPQAQAGVDVEDGGLFRGIRPTLGPVRWRASLTSEYRLQMPPSQPATRSFMEFGTLNAASYFFQPWFAQLGANLGFVRSTSSGGESPKSKSDGLTGGGSLALFPASRFPFSATYSVNDSRTSGENTGADYRSTQLGLRQSYRSLDDTQYSASFERSELNGSTIGKDVLNVFGVTASARHGAQSYDLDGHWSGNAAGVSGMQSNLARLTGRHGYVPASNLNVQTIASYNRQELEQTTASLRNSLSNRFLQLATTASWRPEEDEPLYDEKHPMLIAGGLRLSATGTEQAAGSTENLNASGSLGLTYTINPLTRLSASATAAQTSAGGGAGGLSSSQNASISYAPLPMRLGEYTYNWNLSGGGSNSTGAGQGRQALFTQASHQVSRSYALAEDSRIALSIGQGAGANLASGGTGQSLTHNAQATWSLLGETATQTYVSLSASDARSFGAAANEFQLVNLQATRQAPLSALSFWTANITVQGSRQRTDSIGGGATAARAGGFNVTTFGNVTYQHTRVFSVPRLRLFASYLANQAQLQSRAQGDIDAPRQAVSDALEARLEYRIGKVDSRLTFRSATVEGKRNTLLYLRVTRQF